MTKDNPEWPKGPPRPIGIPMPKASPEDQSGSQAIAAPKAMQPLPRKSADGNSPADWLKPTAEATGDVPDVSVPAGTLQSTYTDWAEQRAQAGGTSSTAIVAVLLGTCGAAIGNARVATAGPGTWFIAILWIMTVGKSGAAKSPAMWSVIRLYEKLEKRLQAAHGDDQDLTEQERADIAVACAERARILSAMNDIGAGPEFNEAPLDDQPFARFILNGGSLPGLEKIGRRAEKGAVVIQDELSALFDENPAVLQILLTAHDGKNYRRDLDNKEIFIPNFALTVIGGIQPDVLKKYFAKFRNNGLLARFLPVVIQRKIRTPFDGQIDDTKVFSALAWLRSLKMEDGEFGPEGRVVPFTADARTAYFEGVSRIETLASRETGLVESFLYKGTVTIGRLALVLTYMDAAVGTREEPATIEVSAVRRATALFESVFVPMAREAFFEESAPRYKRDARTIVDIIRRLDVTRVTVREINRAGGDRFPKASDVEYGFAELTKKGVLRHDKGISGPKGGRPSHGYLVNPHILHRKPETGGG